MQDYASPTFIFPYKRDALYLILRLVTAEVAISIWSIGQSDRLSPSPPRFTDFCAAPGIDPDPAFMRQSSAIGGEESSAKEGVGAEGGLFRAA